MYNIDASMYVVTLPDSILVSYRLLLPPNWLLHLREIVLVGKEVAVVYCQLAQVCLPHRYYVW